MFFCSTQLFREFKLCKLLLRPLDDRYSASRGSTQNIRGYSRQSESYVSSLSNSADNSANDVDDADFNFEGHFNASQLFRYQRPGSRALSVPVPVSYAHGKWDYRNKTSVPMFYRGNKVWVQVWVGMN